MLLEKRRRFIGDLSAEVKEALGLDQFVPLDIDLLLCAILEDSSTRSVYERKLIAFLAKTSSDSRAVGDCGVLPPLDYVRDVH